MEIIRGKEVSFVDTSELERRVAGYDKIHIDIGTGDGRFVRHMAQTISNCFAIGVDSCRENLREVSRRAPTNSLFIIGNAQDLPCEIHGLATQITINFPWGSLLESLLANDPALLTGLLMTAQPHAKFEARLNGEALAKAGWSLEEGAQRVRDALALNGFNMRYPSVLAPSELRSCPTTWAKRLAFGRDPRAMVLHGTKKADRVVALA